MLSKLLTVPLVVAAGVVAHPAFFARHAPFARRDVPSLSQWSSSGLESYWSYKVRYQSLNCDGQQGSDFFNTCCNPLPAGQTTANLPAECQPSTLSCASNSPSTITTPPPADNGSTTQSNNGEDCDDGDDYSDDAYTPPADNSGQDWSQSTDNSGYSDNSGDNNNGGDNGGNNGGDTGGNTGGDTGSNTGGNTGGDNGGNNGGGNSDVITGGFATYFYQNGVAGACGTVHGEYDLIGAIDVAWYGDMGQQSQYCGRSVHVTNLNNGQSVDITVADVCPTCDTSNSFDLSFGAFSAIADPNDGEVPIVWSFN